MKAHNCNQRILQQIHHRIIVFFNDRVLVLLLDSSQSFQSNSGHEGKYHQHPSIFED